MTNASPERADERTSQALDDVRDLLRKWRHDLVNWETMPSSTDSVADSVVAILAASSAPSPPHPEREETLREALTDMLSGWRYIRTRHGDLYGVGWDRCEASAMAALSTAPPAAEDKIEAQDGRVLGIAHPKGAQDGPASSAPTEPAPGVEEMPFTDADKAVDQLRWVAAGNYRECTLRLDQDRARDVVEALASPPATPLREAAEKPKPDLLEAAWKALKRIASDHVGNGKEGHAAIGANHLYFTDCDACHRQEIAHDALAALNAAGADKERG